jgi:Stage II sporulation protein E (SpoIIE)
MFTVLDRISWPGSIDRANEDTCGSAGDWAWVIDTFIPPGTPAALHPQSDAAWLAGFAGERLAALASQATDGVMLVRRVMTDARDAFLAKTPSERQDFMTWPAGAMTLLRGGDGRLDIWTFGDTTAFIRPPDGTLRTIGEAPELRVAESAKAAEFLKVTGATPKGLLTTPLVRQWLSDRREQQRTGEGMPLLGLRPEAAEKLRHDRAELASGTIVLLTSDGFSALVDLYRHVDAKGLVETALSFGLESLVREARRIETEVDPDGRSFPRFKQSDDATALLVRWG